MLRTCRATILGRLVGACPHPWRPPKRAWPVASSHLVVVTQTPTLAVALAKEDFPALWTSYAAHVLLANHCTHFAASASPAARPPRGRARCLTHRLHDHRTCLAAREESPSPHVPPNNAPGFAGARAPSSSTPIPAPQDTQATPLAMLDIALRENCEGCA